MKKLRKLLSALLAVAMLMSMVLPVSAEGIAATVPNFELLEAAPAEETVDTVPEVEAVETAPAMVVTEEITVQAEVTNSDETSAQPIELDQTVTVSLDSGVPVFYSFTPAESGTYILHGEQAGAIWVDGMIAATEEWFDSVWWYSDNEGGYAFDLTAGTEYLFQVSNWAEDSIACDLTLTKGSNFDTLEFHQQDVTAYLNDGFNLSVQTGPEFGSEEITWTIADTSILEFEDAKATTSSTSSSRYQWFIPKAVGTTTVTATTANSGLSTTCTVTVKEMETITGDSFDVSLPANGEEAFLYTPAESGTYIFYFDENTWGIGFTVYRSDDNYWIDRGDWENSQTGDHGNAFALTGGTTYRIVVDNHESMDRYETVSIAKAVPYDTLWIEGSSTAYVGSDIYLNLRGTPDFAMEAAQWTVSNPDVVEVRYTGATAIDLIGLSAGTTTVTATTASGKSVSYEITVKEKETISLGQTVDISLEREESVAFTFTPAETARYIFYRPGNNGFNIEIRDENGWYVDGSQWFDSNIDFWGNAADLTAGETYTIMANNWNDRNVNSSLTVVKADAIESLSFEKDVYTVFVGTYQDLHLAIQPYFGCEAVSYTTSDSSVAFIEGEDAMGVGLSFGKVGTATITATTAGGLTASCTVNVVEMPALSMEPTQVVLPVEDSVTYSFTPTESGNYIFYHPMNENYSIDIMLPEYGYVGDGEWYSDDDTYYGRTATLNAGEKYLVQLNSWRDYEQTVTIAIAKAVPYEHIAFRNSPMGFVGETAYVQVVGGPGFAFEQMQWTSSNTAVATLRYDNGTGADFACLSEGTTTITATTASGKSVSYEMVVKEKPVLKVGETTVLTIPYDTYTKVLFAPAEDGTYIFNYPATDYFGLYDCYDDDWNWYQSSDWSSSDGTRRGASYTLQGGTTYTLEVYNWNVQGVAELEMTVTKAVPYTKLAFTQDSYTGYVSNFQSVPVYLDYAPEYGGEELIVTSSNPEVAEYSRISGDCVYLNPVAVGTATVTIATADGRLTDTCTVTVKEPITITSGKEQSITLDPGANMIFEFVAPTDETYSFYCADSDYFGFSVYDVNGEWIDTDDRWTGDALIAGINAAAGETYYVSFHSNSDEKATYTVGIGQPTKASSMTIPAYEYTIYTDFSFYLAPVFAPVLAEAEDVTWSSSNEKVAEFVQKCEYEGGYVDYEFYAVGAGTTTITATTASGLKATCKITVVAPEKIDMGTKSVTLSKWDTVMYEFTAPEAGTYVIYDEDPDSLVGWYADQTNGTLQGYEDGNKRGVKITLAAGEIAWPAVSNNTDETKTFTFTIEQGVHEHEIKLVEAKDATYAQPGNIAHYACACGKLYADAEGKTELTEADVTVPVLEGAITLKGEESKEVTIAAGEEVVYLFTAEKTGTYSFVTDHQIGWNLAVETADGQAVAITERPAAADLSGAYQLFGYDVPMTAEETYILKVSHDMEWEESFEFAIGQFAAATSMKLDKSEVTVYPYEQFALNPDFGSIFAIAEDVTFTSSNPAIVEFNPNYEEETGMGGYGFKPLKPGKVTITATSENGLKATCTVTVKTPSSIGLGEHTTPVLNDDDSIAYYFTPEVSGKYDLYLTSEMDFVLSWSSLKENERELWKGPEYVGFRAYLEAGETYTVYINNFYMQGSKTFTFWLSEAHEHAIKPVEAKAPTYTEDGYEAHYACDCGVLFADAEGTTEITMDSIRIPMLIQISEGKAEVPKEVIDEFVAEVEQGGEVSIPVAEAGTNAEAEVKSAALPVQSLTQITEKEAVLTVEMPAATVTMDTAALAAVVEKTGGAGEVTLEVKEVTEEDLTESQMAAIEAMEKKPDFTISAELLVGGQSVAGKDDGGFAGGKVTVKIPVGAGKAEYSVLYIADDGTVEEIPATLQDGCLIIELNHFSDYAVIKHTLLGDVNGDGVVGIADLMRLANHFAKKAEINEANADCNGDGTVTISDLMRLANFFAGKAQLG